MDWDLVIERNRLGLAAIVAALVAMAGWAEPPPPGAATLPRPLRLLILRLLRPAESAVRRLILVAARGLTVEAPALKTPAGAPARAKPALAVWQGKTMPVGRIAALVAAGVSSPYALPPRPAARSMAFPLFDPLKRFRPAGRRVARCAPRVGFPDRPLMPLAPPASPDGPVGAHRLALRLAAIEAALGDIAGEARRLAVALARGAAERARDPAARPKRRRLPPRRPGHPPGHRRRQTHAVDAILADCDAFAREAERDTS
ncbi:MAG: hypothetical protein IPL47_08715 [Phyllobacteriaceae bacterium]|nr:hypothetical protein [Phyllobacteriaceae bacterium]